MRNIPYWLNIGSILHQYGCATMVMLATSNSIIWSERMYTAAEADDDDDDEWAALYCVVYSSISVLCWPLSSS